MIIIMIMMLALVNYTTVRICRKRKKNIRLFRLKFSHFVLPCKKNVCHCLHLFCAAVVTCVGPWVHAGVHAWL